MVKSNKDEVARTATKQLEAFELHKKGHSFNEIAKIMGISRNWANTLFNRELKLITSELRDMAEDYVNVELVRLDYVTRLILRDIDTTIEADKIRVHGGGDEPQEITTVDVMQRVDPKLVDCLMKVMDRRAKYMGLNAPERREVKVTATLEDLVSGSIIETEAKEVLAEVKEVITEEILGEVEDD